MKKAGETSQLKQSNFNIKNSGYATKFKKKMANCGLKVNDIVADGKIRDGDGSGKYVVYENIHPLKSYSIVSFFQVTCDPKKLYYIKSWEQEEDLSQKQKKKLESRFTERKEDAVKKLGLDKNDIKIIDTAKTPQEKNKKIQPPQKNNKRKCNQDNSNVDLEICKNDCIQQMRKSGLILDNFTFKSDKFIRVPTIEDKRSEKSGWYISNSIKSNKGQTHFICTFGDWRTESKDCFKSWSKSNVSEEEHKQLQKKYTEYQEKLKKEIKKEYDKAAQIAQKIYKNAHENAPREEFSKYHTIKGIKAVSGIRYGLNPSGFPAIIIPLRNNSGEIRSLQFISVCTQSGEVYKTFLEGGEIKRNFFIIGAIENKNIYAVEGYATGATVNNIRNLPVLVSFMKRNIDPAIESFKAEFPKNKIIIAGDDDELDKKGKNGGKEAAIAAAKKHGCSVVFPKFPPGKTHDSEGEKYTDF